MKKKLIEIVLADRNWILEKFANEIAKNINLKHVNIQICDQASETADLTFFLPYSVFKYIPNSINVALFTHMEEDFSEAKHKFFNVAKQCDMCITMSKKYEIILKENGITHVQTILPGIDHDKFSPKLKLGVIGRTYHTHRKLEGIVAPLLSLDGVEIVYTGQGWLGKSQKLTDQELSEFYNQIDYLLITSKIEGGPMPLLEALASGCEVIAPNDLGFVDEFPHINYKKGDQNDLKNVIEGLLEKKRSLVESVNDLTWEKYADEHAELFLNLLKNHPANDNNTDAANKLKVTIFTHGSESKTKGGPSIRTKLIAHHLADNSQIDSIQTQFYTEGNINTSADICHVFNIWPLSTAKNLIHTLKSKGKTVVFSPIFLNLSTLKTYSHEVLDIFKTSENIDNDIHTLFLRESKKEKDFLVETISNHFESVKELCDMSDKLIFLSEYEKNLLSQIGVDTSKGEIVLNGVDIPLDGSIDPTLFRKKFGLKRYVLTVGRIESRKNQLILAHALKNLGINLVIIGHSDTSEYANLLKKYSNENVVLIDRIENRELLYSAYAGADVFILPSWSEGAPLAALEASSMGTPLIVSALSGENEYFGDFAKYIHPLDIKGMQKAVTEFLELENIEKYRDEFSQFVKQRYNIDKHVHDTLNVYLSLHNTPVLEKNEQTRITLVDISSLLHTYANNHNPTGGPALEEKIFNVLITMQHINCEFICWNSSYNNFVKIPKGLIDVNELKSYAKEYVDINEKIDYLHEIVDEIPLLDNLDQADQMQIAKLSKIVDNMQKNVYDNRKLLIQLRKNIINSLPVKLRNFILAVIKKYINKNYDVNYPTLTGANSIKNRKDTINTVQNNIDFTYIKNYTMKSYINFSYIYNSQIISIGNAWMSNERYLSTLQNIKYNYNATISFLVYDILPITKPAFFPRNSQTKFESHFEKLITFSDKIYALSRYTRREIQDYLAMKKQHLKLETLDIDTFVPNGCDQNARKSEFLNQQPIERDQFILFVASISPRKNHEMLVKVWQKIHNDPKVHDKKLVIVGKHLFKNEDLISTESVQELRKSNVIFLSSVTQDDLHWLYSNCMFTVYPSLVEGLGLPILESLAYKKVSVCSNMESIEHIMKNGIVKLDPTSFFAWYEVIYNLLTNEYLLKSVTDSIEKESDDECFQNVVRIMMK